jgi:hypothetical protein
LTHINLLELKPLQIQLALTVAFNSEKHLEEINEKLLKLINSKVNNTFTENIKKDIYYNLLTIVINKEIKNILDVDFEVKKSLNSDLSDVQIFELVQKIEQICNYDRDILKMDDVINHILGVINALNKI